MPMPHPGLVVAGPVHTRARFPARAVAFTLAVTVVLGLGIVASTTPIAAASTVAALIPAALVDLRERRLPDRLVGAALAVFLVAAVAATVAGSPVGVSGPVIGAAALAVPVLVVHLVSPSAMGFGDVKAAAVLGLAAGVVHWQLALTALALAAGGAGVVGIALGRRTIALGPFLVLGTAIALASANVWLPEAVETATAMEVVP